MEIREIIARWDSGEGKPYKGSLIDREAYEADPENMGCMCAQGQVLHAIGGWGFARLMAAKQSEADAETAKLLDISRNVLRYRLGRYGMLPGSQREGPRSSASDRQL